MTVHEEYERRCREESDIAGHLPFLYESVCRFPGARVLELGVRSGNSTAALLAGVERVDGHLWSVDAARPRVPRHWHRLPFWDFIRGDDLAVSLPDEFDIVFIDTSHTYEQTRAEIERYAHRVSSGGVILLHDTDLPGSGVRQALDEFCDWENRPGHYGMGVICVS